MDPISNVDRLVLLLRQRLTERSKSAARRGDSRAQGSRPNEQLSAVQAMAAVADMDERHLRRALIQNLLSESLGPKLVNEAVFQQLVDRVTETIEAEPETARLLQRLVADLRAAPR